MTKRAITAYVGDSIERGRNALVALVGMDYKRVATWLQVVHQPTALSRLVRPVNFALVVGLAYTCAQLTWLLVPRAQTSTAPPPPQATTRPLNGGATMAASSVNPAQYHLFGRADEIVAKAPEPVQVVETPLRLELRGVVASSSPPLARAIIADESRNENLYALESPLPGGAVLKEIYEDRVVFLRNNRMEVLRLPKDRLDTMAPGGPAQGVSLNMPRPGVGRPAMPGGEDNIASEPAPGISDDTTLGQIRDQLLSDPQSLMGLLQAQPEMEGDSIVGYRLGEAQDSPVLRKVGLRRGDVVTSVNGVQLNGPTKLPELLQMLPNATELRIEYRRRGRPRSIVLNMTQ